jgi:hypothetical protein
MPTVDCAIIISSRDLEGKLHPQGQTQVVNNRPLILAVVHLPVEHHLRLRPRRDVALQSPPFRRHERRDGGGSFAGVSLSFCEFLLFL